VDAAAAAREGLEVVARPSGGGPVLWDHDLIAIDVILPAGHPLLPADVVAAYRWVGEAVASTLGHLGIEGARAVPPGEAREWLRGEASGLCFGGLSPWEVVVGDRKVLGLSQVRRQAGGIVQVGVPMQLDAARLARAVGASAAAADDLAARTAGIADLAPGVTREQATNALVAALF
jgi:lipoate-protein ligase A